MINGEYYDVVLLSMIIYENLIINNEFNRNEYWKIFVCFSDDY